jgi:hypothetical protein
MSSDTGDRRHILHRRAPGRVLPRHPPDWTRVADQVLLTPLGVDGLDEQLAEADRLRADRPLAAAGM